MNPFTEAELAYLTGEPRLARLATVGLDGMPHIAPVGWSYNAELGTIDIGGHDFARTKKFRDVARAGPGRHRRRRRAAALATARRGGAGDRRSDRRSPGADPAAPAAHRFVGARERRAGRASRAGRGLGGLTAASGSRGAPCSSGPHR